MTESQLTILDRTLITITMQPIVSKITKILLQTQEGKGKMARYCGGHKDHVTGISDKGKMYLTENHFSFATDDKDPFIFIPTQRTSKQKKVTGSIGELPLKEDYYTL